ncbi:uncharacterized protein LOC128553062 [Mercenaria mercenaria]|uniref:uncharacterized protein LOC128553062 n=1 Tax=Mercenaria mercenaria TaxID=6596 RepID=UPI00234ED73C|nr:uncharacterized protein LOC128553062 [Mercenaria mercenaria]
MRGSQWGLFSHIDHIFEVIDSELTLSAPVNENEPVELAEEIITTVINQAIEEVGDANNYPKIRLAVKKILEDIKKIPHVEIGKAEHKCVILRFRCTTYKAVLDLLLYMESEMYKTRLDALANAVSTEMFDNPSSCKLHAAVVTECLTTILHELRAESSKSMQHKKTIKLPIKLQTVEGFENIWNIFEGNGALEQFQELSDAISEHLDTKITVTPSLNIDALMTSASMTIAESQIDSHADIAFIEPSEAQNQDTNFIFEYVRKTKDDDSAIGGSIITSQSNKPFSVSEGYVPAEPRLGDLIQIQMESDEIYIGRCTVGPIVSVSDAEEKCFITVGNNPGVLNKANVHVSIDENPMRMLAWDSTYGTVLVAPDLGTQAEATALGNAMAANAEDLGDAASAHVNLSGLRVCKIGAKTKLTEGMIIGSVENMIVGGTQEALKNAVYVETLPGADDHPFASTGDAGAMVYHEKSYGSFKCIGVLLGEKIRIDAHTEYFVVRLIDDILQDFEKRLGKQITLDYSTMKEQILSTIEEHGHENLFLD